MYLEHYGLAEPPFSITPDPRFVFLSERHRDALAHLLFGIGQGGGGGFVQLTGEVGTGKTTLSRLLLEQLPPNTRVALVLNPRLSPVELLEAVCEELHIDLAGKRGSLKLLVDALNAYLLGAYAQGLRVVLIIDEAQNLSVEALEQVRLLTNLETDTQKLLQIILLGQPELRDMLARGELRQLAQRITARYHLTPLDARETEAYLRHRYAVAGGRHFPFSAAAAQRIHAHAGGVPRLINVIAERALLAGYAHDRTALDPATVDRAAREALPPARARLPQRRHVLAAAAVAAVVALAIWWWPQAPVSPVTAKPVVVASTKKAPAVRPAVPRLAVAEVAQRLAATDANAPLQHLLALWQASATLESARLAACPAAPAPGWYCSRGRALLDRLVALDRPLLLRLQADGQDGWAVLLGADAVDVRLALDGDAFDVDRIALQRMWNGEYLALWRAPEALAAALAPDARGPAVDWVRTHLQPRYRGPAILDADMIAAVRAFQQARGLATDGVIGPETLMALAASDAGPRLQRNLD